ncbi:MAG: LamG-like jellyroll fold domain-containing protein [Candidatus Thorarchaeota archaeon]
MASDLFNLFRDTLKTEKDTVATSPLTLDNISEFEEEQELIIEKVASLENVEIKVDYSDFENFVFFNSALDYFNITGEKILNEYPFASSCNNIEVFTNDLDGYQKHVLKSWPKSVGYLNFDTSISSSFITVEDIGIEEGIARGGILSPGSGSLTLETWFKAGKLLTGTEEVQIIAQKLSGSGTGGNYSLYLTGSEVAFTVRSGSSENTVKAPFNIDQITYVAGVMDRSAFSGSLFIVTGSQSEFPVVVSTSSLSFYRNLDLATAPLTIASGSGEILSAGSKDVTLFSGSLDDVKVWKKAKSISEISGTFNVKQFAQKNLVALYRFNEPDTAFEEEDNRIVLDYSGHNLSGRISDYHVDMRVSGTFLIRENPDPILNFNTSDVSSFISEQQSSGSLFDRNNSNKITDMMPENYFILEELEGTEVLKNFLYVMARHYDSIKLHMDQFINILHVNYGEFDQTPDALLDDVAQFFGWEFTGNFLNAEAFQYFIGRNVLKNVQSNDDLDTKLFEIKNKFWKRILLNLMYLYKTKGTKESIKALMRTYGLKDNFIRIKEFGHNANVGIQTNRIHADKSVNALGFGSTSLTASVFQSTSLPTGSFTVETRVRFPLTSSDGIVPTSTSGSIWSMGRNNSAFVLKYEKDAIESHSGSLILSSSDGTNLLTLGSVGVFNNEWQNVSVIYNDISSSLSIEVRDLDEDVVDSYFTSSIGSVIDGRVVVGQFDKFGVGGLRANQFVSLPDEYAAQYWMQEVRLWDKALDPQELDDHTLNYQSFGVCDPAGADDELLLHWRLREDVTGSVAGVIDVEDASTNGVAGAGANFGASTNPYKKFLNDYNYIASLDFGWTDNKIRTIDSPTIERNNYVKDSNVVSLEFNMIDALNEDIVQMIKSMDLMNEAIGFPANRYRVQYDDLEIIRLNYFKRLQGRLNFRVFADMLDFFDRSFIDTVKRLLPARSTFIGEEFVVESHLLERPKITYERRKNQEVEFVPEGKIEVWTRFGINDDQSGRKFPIFLTGSAG